MKEKKMLTDGEDRDQENKDIEKKRRSQTSVEDW